MVIRILLLLLPISLLSQVRDTVPSDRILVENWPFGTPKEILDRATDLVIKYQETKDITFYYRAQREYELLKIRKDTIPLVMYHYDQTPDTIKYLIPQKDTLYTKGMDAMVLTTHKTITYELYRLRSDTIAWTVEWNYQNQLSTSLREEDSSEKRTTGNEIISCQRMKQKPLLSKYRKKKEYGPYTSRMVNKRWLLDLKT